MEAAVAVGAVMGSNIGVAESVLANLEEVFFGGAAKLRDEIVQEIVVVKLEIGNLAVETETNGDIDFIV